MPPLPRLPSTKKGLTVLVHPHRPLGDVALLKEHVHEAKANRERRGLQLTGGVAAEVVVRPGELLA